MSVLVIQVDDAVGRKLAELAKKSPGKSAETLIADAIDAYLNSRADVHERIALAAEESTFLFDRRNSAR